MTPPEWFTAVPGVAYDAIRWGNPNATIALCTLWGRVDHVKDVDTYCMMGNCVSPVGVDFVVRTLLANPQIKVLRVEGPDLSGTKALLHAAVRVTTVSGVPLVVDSYSGDGARVYYLCQRESNIVPVPPPDPGESPTGRGWPGQRIVGTSLWDVWPRVIGEVVRHGAVSPTAYGTEQRECLALTWVFGVAATLAEVPEWAGALQFNGLPEDACAADLREALDHYAAVHFLGTAPAPEGVEYTYSDRLRRRWDDQIARCIETLRADPEQRRAVAVTWDVGKSSQFDPTASALASLVKQAGDRLSPAERRALDLRFASDAAGKNPPCLVMLWFRRGTDGSLFTHATFRSHDLYKAGVPNAWGLCRLAEHVAGELDWPVGRLAICSLSAHVYGQDWEAARTLAQERGRRVYEDDSERAILRVRSTPPDPNSNPCPVCAAAVGSACPLEVAHAERSLLAHQGVAVDLLGPDGATRATIEGATAEGVEREVLEAGWVSTLSHAAFMAREIARLETPR